jgi:beta-lactam-binding protein with PASTA domain
VTSGLVVSTIPAAGAPVKAGAAIELVTSSGVCNVVVPNVVGFGSNAATSSLTANHLVGAFSDAPLGTCPVTEAPGTVLTQSVQGGDNAPYGSTIDLTVCPGPLDY